MKKETLLKAGPWVVGLLMVTWMGTWVHAGSISGCINKQGDLQKVALGEDPAKPCSKNEGRFVYELAPSPTQSSCQYFDVWTLAETGNAIRDRYAAFNFAESSGDYIQAVIGIKWDNVQEMGPVAVSWEADFTWWIDEWSPGDHLGGIQFFPELGAIRGTDEPAGLHWYKYSGNFGPTGATVELDLSSGEAILVLPMGTQWWRIDSTNAQWPYGTAPAAIGMIIEELRMTVLESGRTITCTYDSSWVPQ